jgi:imidazolonepropionase-like amidohydrolase
MSSFNQGIVIFAGVVGISLAVLVLLPEPDRPTRSVAGASVADGDPRSFALTGVRLFDGREVIEDASVVWSDGVVVAAGADVEVPADAERIDATGKTALPGLIRSPNDFQAQHAARGSTDPTARADLFSAGFLATAEGGHGTQFGIEVPIPDGPADTRAWVDARLAEGSDWIKIVVEGGRIWGSETPTLDAATVQALVEAAHAREVLAVAHVSTRAEAELAVAAGVDGLVHLFVDEPLDAAMAEQWAQRGLFVVPTLPVLAAAHHQPGANRLAGFEALSDKLSSEQRRSLDAVFPGAAMRSARWPGVESAIATLHEAGVRLLAGSDAPNPGTAHGLSLLDSVIRLHEAGLSPVEALRAATSVPASVFPIGERGCLRPDCRADLLLVNGNPLEDPAALLAIEGIWKNGSPVPLDIDAAPPAEPEPAAAPVEAVDLLAPPTGWMASADNFMGGASESAIEPADGSLRVTGTLRAGFAFPYAGAMWNAGDFPMEAVDRRGWSTFRLNVDSQLGMLRVMFFSGGNPQPIWRNIAPNGPIEIDLSELGGLDLAAFQAVGIYAAQPNGDFEFLINEARFE